MRIQEREQKNCGARQSKKQIKITFPPGTSEHVYLVHNMWIPTHKGAIIFLLDCCIATYVCTLYVDRFVKRPD